MSSVGSSFQELAKLNLSNLPLFGREQELSVLEAAWSRTLEGSSESVFVEGSIGSGKTALVTEFVRRLESSCPEDFDLGNRRIFFCSGKCEQAKPQEPYHALRQALTDLCEAILNSTAKDGICKRLRESIGADGYILAEAVPGLLAIVGDVSKGHSNKSESSEGNQTSSVERLKEQLKVFLRIVCSEDRKVILFLDDLQELQWSDKATIELLQYVINDSEIRNFMFVGAFSFTGKDKCNDEGNKQTKELMEAVRQSESAFSHINVENLGIEGLNEMLVYLLKLDSDHTRPLARIIHRKTLGDVSVALDFLQQLVQDKFLVYSLSTYQWEIKLEDIEAKTSVAEPVIDIISDRLFNFPFHIQQILMVGASLASKFDVPTLNLVLKEMPDDFSIPHTIEEELQLLLRLPVSEGLLDDLGGGSLKFSHERIREATYGLLPSGDERDQYHYKLGKILLRLRDNAKDGKQRFTLMAADQLNLGSKAIHKFEEKLELAEINLLAGKKAKSLSAFVPAWRYFNFGISMLGDESKSWQVHYNLSLALYTNAVEMASCLGYYEQSIPLADTVLKNAKSSRDKAPIYFAKVNLLGQNEKFEEAMDLSSKLLSQLGESLPSKPKKYHVMSALRKTEELMKGKTDEDILSLPIVTEARVITIMKLLNTYCVHSLFLQKTYSMLLSSLRMNLMTFKHGLTSSSPSALCFYAFVIANNGKVDEAVRIGRLAIKLVTTLKAHEWQANCINVHVSFVRHWREPYSVCMNHSLEGYKSGMMFGDIEFAFFNGICYVSMYYLSGLPLKPVERDCRAYCKRMLEYGRENIYAVSCPTWQLLLNLIGKAEDSHKLSGEAMVEDSFVTKYKKCRNIGALQAFWLSKGQLAYFFGDYEEADRVWTKFGRTKANLTSHFSVVVHAYFHALTCLALARENRSRKHKAAAQKLIRTISSWVQGGNINLSHKLMLLNAEFTALNVNDGDRIRKMYDAAIVAASRSGFVHDAAIASQRAGMYCLDLGDTFWAAEYLTRALRLYSDWGAVGLVRALLPKYLPILEKEESVYSEVTAEVLSFSAVPGTTTPHNPSGNGPARPLLQQGGRFSTSHRGVEHYDPGTARKHETLSSRFFVEADSAAFTNTMVGR